MAIDTSAWKRCSSCKNDISFRATYWVCSVSTCTRKRTGMVFCSVACWEMHLPMMRHREAYALEERSPSPAEWQREQERELAESQAAPAPAASAPAASAPAASSQAVPASRHVQAAASPGVVARRRMVEPPPEISPEEAELANDILIVASKLKKYIRVRSGMNTSEGVMSVLSDHLRALCNQAIRTAAQDGRKTVLDRDIPKVVGD